MFCFKSQVPCRNLVTSSWFHQSGSVITGGIVLASFTQCLQSAQVITSEINLDTYNIYNLQQCQGLRVTLLDPKILSIHSLFKIVDL